MNLRIGLPLIGLETQRELSVVGLNGRPGLGCHKSGKQQGAERHSAGERIHVSKVPSGVYGCQASSVHPQSMAKAGGWLKPSIQAVMLSMRTL